MANTSPKLSPWASTTRNNNTTVTVKVLSPITSTTALTRTVLVAASSIAGSTCFAWDEKSPSELIENRSQRKTISYLGMLKLSKSVDHIMEEGCELDLTYITERIIAVSFPTACSEETYLHNLQDVTRMLKSKHADNYLVFNLSEKRYDLSKLNPKIMDVGWPDLHAPPLDKMCTICKAMESWLNSDSHHVVVIHCKGAVDGNLYAKVRKKSSSDCSLAVGAHGVAVTSSPDHSDHTLSVSSDSGHSTASIRTDRTSGIKRGLSMQEKAELDRLLSGFGLENPTPFKEMSGGNQLSCVQHVVPAQVHVNGEVKLKHRETDILDDEMPNHDLHSVDSIGTLSSSEGQHYNHIGHFGFHKSSQNSLLSDGFCSNTGDDHHTSIAPDLGISVDVYERAFSDANQGYLPQRNPPVSMATTPKPQAFGQSGYSTQTWVRQQQMVAAQQYRYSPADSNVRTSPENKQSNPETKPKHPNTSTRGSSSRDAVQRGIVVGYLPTANKSPKETNGFDHTCKEEDLPSSPTMDIDQSIEQLNQLIMDLDPTFVPIPTRMNSVKRGGMAQMNGSASSKEEGVAATNRVNTTLQEKREVEISQNIHQPVLLFSLRRSRGSPCGLGVSAESDLSRLDDSRVSRYREGNDEIDGRIMSPMGSANEMVPPTPAFPISPPTPYEPRNYMEGISQSAVTSDSNVGAIYRTDVQMTSTSSQRPFGSMCSVSTEPRNYMEGISQSAVTSDSNVGAIYRTDAQMTSTSSQRPFGSMCSVSTGRPVPRTQSPLSSGQPWSESNSKTHVSLQSSLTGMSRSTTHYLGCAESSASSVSPSQDLVLLSQYTTSQVSPNSHSSPRELQQDNLANNQGTKACRNYSSSSSNVSGGQQFDGQHTSMFSSLPVGTNSPSTENMQVSALLDNENPQHNLLIADGGLSQHSPTLRPTGMNMTLQPPLPEKKRVSEGERSFCSISPSSSGFSSPHSGSTISIPFPSVLPDFSKVLSTSTVPDSSSNKQVTVKFVQDTSKSWYKPDISRDQAIAVLKDKEPGSFIVRDSHSFRGAYGLAMKVATPPPSVLQQNKKDPLEDIGESISQSATNSASELLKQGAACNVWYLGSVEMESLTGYQAVQKATSVSLAMDPPPTSTVVHFKVSAQGITLTDNQRKLFFRRHYTVNTVIFCALDPRDRKIFGFVARKQGSATDNVCHLFAEHDPEQPASAIVNFVSKQTIALYRPLTDSLLRPSLCYFKSTTVLQALACGMSRLGDTSPQERPSLADGVVDTGSKGTLLLRRWRQESGRPDPEPTELELLLQKWEGVVLPSREPEGMELPSREPEGVELPSREPEGVELPSREPEGVALPSREPEGVALLPEQDKELFLSPEPPTEVKVEEVSNPPPTESQQQAGGGTPVLSSVVPCSSYVDTSPE
ncbi:UNVERIFIED_CONTAM: hypothetical protein FKN15_071399 [Acipenser sinensis]